jgi:cbb3-type cytochrome oxidase subunit 3
MFVTVPGEAREQLNMVQFGAYVDGKDGATGQFKSFFFGSAPEKLAYRLENKGNVAESPVGSIVVKDMFGRQIKSIDSANPKSQLALIGQTRRFEVCLSTKKVEIKGPAGQTSEQDVCDKPSLMPGRYTAELAAFYGINSDNNQEIRASATFWYLPAWFIIVVVLLIVAVAFVIYRLTHKLKRRTRRSRR